MFGLVPALYNYVSNLMENQTAFPSPWREDGAFQPTPIDIVVVRAMLCRGKRLYPDLVDSIFDFAEYWAHSTTRLEQSIRVAGGNENHENRLLLRSYPLGLVDLGEGRTVADHFHYTTTVPAPRKLNREIDRTIFAKTARYPTPKLAHPARKVVFKFRSQDQGFSTERSTSWTWFEAGLERFSAPTDNESDDTSSAAQDNLPSVNDLRPVYPDIEEQPSNPGEYRYLHPLHPSPELGIKRNRLALREWEDHVVTWTYLDNIHPESDGGKDLEDQGRGRATGDGEFVRNLRLGDVITIWGKARFHAWANRIESVQIDVYWAL